VDPSDRAIVDETAEALRRLVQGERPSLIAISGAEGDQSLKRLVEVTNLFLIQHAESRQFLEMLAGGDLDCDPPPRNLLLSPFKQLHSNLRHLVWQTHQVAKGDLSQQVDFLGTFADAFNSMIASLREKRRIEEELREANTTIVEGMQYARTIQTALLPRESEIFLSSRQFFALWKPRELIGGDLFAFRAVPGGFIVAVMDCTGHGVPGAVMTMIAGTCFQRALEEEGHEDPARVLLSLNRLVKETLNQHHQETPSDDGLDIALCHVDQLGHSLKFAGAKIGLLALRDGKVQEILPDKQSLGYKSSHRHFNYKTHLLEDIQGTSFYLATDGLTDQIGGPRGFPLGKSRLKKFLEANAGMPMAQQKAALESHLDQWRGLEPQVDDITCVGFSL